MKTRKNTQPKVVLLDVGAIDPSPFQGAQEF